MTNEEKAIEIANNDDLYNIENGCIEDCRIAALEMARWKYEQHKQEKQQWIEKACEWWKNELTYPTMTQTEIDWYQTKIAEFKKAMEE